MIRSAEIHARVDWPTVLEVLGIPGTGTKKPRPCPACGGRDRCVTDNRHGRGDYFCRHCGAGDGFELLMKTHGWTFTEARRRVLEVAGLAAERNLGPAPTRSAPSTAPSEPTRRVLGILRSACTVADCEDARAYLASRGLWPLPEGSTLKAHPSVEYFEDSQRIGRFPALIAEVRDRAGALVTCHVTYLRNARKLEGHEPRKLLGPMTGHAGCAVRLLPANGAELGIAEGIETALAAARIHRIPVWSALSTAVLGKFEPPATVNRVLIFADRDTAGLEAASRLTERLRGRIGFELRLPTAKDWAEERTA